MAGLKRKRVSRKFTMRKRRRLSAPRRSGTARRLNRSSRSGPFPRTAIVSLRWVTNKKTVNPGVGTPGTVSFRANSIFEPDAAGTDTHQPYGHDTLATVYERYKVVSAKITVSFVGTGGDQLSGGMASIQLSTAITPTTNTTLMLEQPETTYKPYNPLSYGGKTILSKTYSASKFFGKRRNKDLTAQFGVDPVELAFFHVSAHGSTAAINPAVVDLIVTITYKVIITEPKALGQS